LGYEIGKVFFGHLDATAQLSKPMMIADTVAAATAGATDVGTPI